ncbi:MAG TPA: hypothetical protein QGF58_09525 [Myxococcota bacterium]|nr:hypothetical protein [Myxococcota bacterium]
MRWITLSDLEREPVLEAIDDFWRAFSERVDRIDALFRMHDRWDLVAWMNEHLAPITPGLLWEFGPGPEGAGGHRLVITPESVRSKRAVVATLMERAPELPGWAFSSARPPAGPEIAANFVEHRVGVKLAGASIGVEPAEDHRIGVRWHIPEASAQGVFDAAFVATERLLGERMLDDWVGAIEPADSSEGLRTWETLPVLFHGARNTVLRSLPDLPFHERPPDETPSAMWKLEDATQNDLIVARSTHPAMWKAARTSPMFVSERFSRHGERFATLRLETRDKYELEEALDARLRQDELGAVTGGGAGGDFSTIDIALVDVRRGMDVVKPLAARMATLRFLDADLEDEGLP